MFNTKDLEILKRKLPTNWVARVKEKVPYGATKIREAMEDPANYKDGLEIMDAAIEVADEYLVERDNKIAQQKLRIKQLSAS